jgi:hypothetical protein
MRAAPILAIMTAIPGAPGMMGGGGGGEEELATQPVPAASPYCSPSRRAAVAPAAARAGPGAGMHLPTS